MGCKVHTERDSYGPVIKRNDNASEHFRSLGFVLNSKSSFLHAFFS